MPCDIPVIETRRLLLRGPEAKDYPDFKATFSSYRSRFMGGPLNPYEAWMLYAAEIGHWQVRGFGMWMIHDKATEETYGMAGGWQPAGWPEREIAWIIWPGAAGKGYALEAAHGRTRIFLFKSGLGDCGQLYRPEESRLDPAGGAAWCPQGPRGRNHRRK